jgi:hypothetical protein
MKKSARKITSKKKNKSVKAKGRKATKAKVKAKAVVAKAPKPVVVPRDNKVGRSNRDITHLVENLCLAIFDQDNTGESLHTIDIAKRISQAVRHSYPEIKTVKQLLIYVEWAMKTLCWNNRAKLIAQHWFESIYTTTEAINDALPEGAPWEARQPAKFGPESREEKKAWHFEVDKAKWAIEHLRTQLGWDDQKIITELYAGVTKYAPKSVETALHQMEHAELEREIGDILNAPAPVEVAAEVAAV